NRLGCWSSSERRRFNDCSWLRYAGFASGKGRPATGRQNLVRGWQTGPAFHGNERQHQLGRRAERGRQDRSEIPARRQGANGMGRTLQGGDPRLAKKKCEAAAHLPGRNTDYRESRGKK